MSNMKYFSFARKLTMLLFWGLMLHGMALAQTRPITGYVRDTAGQPLVGATIQVKGSDIIALAGDNCLFSLNVNANRVTIEVTMTSYVPKTLVVEAGAVINVVLETSVQDLDEVVMVGYGRQRKASLTGSVAQISGTELKQAPTGNLSTVLAGRLPGLTVMQQSGRPGFDEATMRIRGINTTGTSSPIVIVDGVQRSFSQLDPNEIESISILKDASAAAVYGLQASNGVILVTTKRGNNQIPKVSYDASVNINSFTRFPKFLDGPDYMYWYTRGEELDNEYLTHTGGSPFPYTYTEAEIEALRNGTNTNPFYGNTDWIDRKSVV